MKTEPDPNHRSSGSGQQQQSTNNVPSSSGPNSGAGKPLLYSKALSSSLPTQTNVAQPSVTSPNPPSQQQQPQQQPQQQSQQTSNSGLHHNSVGNPLIGHNNNNSSTGKQNHNYSRNNGSGRNIGGGNKHNGDNSNHGRNQPKFWNNNGNVQDNTGGDHHSQRETSPQYASSNCQYPGVAAGGGGHGNVGLGGDHGGRKSANSNSYGFQSHSGDTGGSYGYVHQQQPQQTQQQQHHHNHHHPAQHHHHQQQQQQQHHPQQQQQQHHNYNGGPINSRSAGGGGGGGGSSGNDSTRQVTGNSSREYEMSTTNLYICGLKPETTDDDLMKLCSPYGPITTTKAIMDRMTNRCRGFGFVDFQDPSSAELAITNLKFQGVQAQMARCSESKHNKMNVINTPSEHDPTNLYIANLPPQMSEKDLDAMLSNYGTVTSTRILKDVHGASRCVGFARMETREMCDHIISVFKDKVLPGSNEVLMVKYADGGAKKKTFKNNGPRYQNDDSQRSMNDSGSMATNGVSQMLPNQMNGAAAFPNMASYQFMGLNLGMPPMGSQYQQGAPGTGQQLYNPQAVAAAAAVQMQGYPMTDPNAMQMHMHNLMGQMSQMNLNGGYPYGQFVYGMPTAPPQVPQNVETDPNVQSIDAMTGVGGNGEVQPGQDFVHGAPPPPGPNQAALAASMLYTQQAQN